MKKIGNERNMNINTPSFFKLQILFIKIKRTVYEKFYKNELNVSINFIKVYFPYKDIPFSSSNSFLSIITVSLLSLNAHERSCRSKRENLDYLHVFNLTPLSIYFFRTNKRRE